MSEPTSGVHRIRGYSWYCARCGNYGSDWVSADRSDLMRRNKTDAIEEYQAHIDRHHLATTPPTEGR